MNKTVNMNLGGFFFHIDEDAYQKLNRYFDAIKKSLSSDGREEIMNDIESRVSELFSEKLTGAKQVISLKEVDDVIAVMGQPEDYKIEDEAPRQPNYNYASSGSRKLYRDKENGIIGGVLAGLGYYFGIDKVWLRLIMLVLLLSFGTGFLLYIILWIVMPEAVTTTEKLEMQGEPINISNIEKKVKEEFENLSEKFKNADVNFKDGMGTVSEKVKIFSNDFSDKMKSNSSRVGSNLGDVIISILGIFAKFLGALIVMVASISLLGFFVASIVMLFSSTMPDSFALNYISTPIGLETPLWIQGILFLLVFGIPFFFLLILGLKLLVTNLKSIGSIAKYSLLSLWIIALAILIALGIKEATQLAFDGKVVQKQSINISPTDTLFVKFKNNDFYSKDVDNHDDFRLMQDEHGKEIVYSNNVSIEIMPTDEKLPYLQIEKLANGKTPDEAQKRAEKIIYNLKIEGNKLILDNYLLHNVKNRFRDQRVALFLYLPKGTYLKPDSSLRRYEETNGDYFSWNPESKNDVYKVEDNKVKCTNCPANENEESDYEQDDDTNIRTPNVTINEDVISIKNDTTISSAKDFKELKINKDGIIIKTK
ncbi:PspC domain-containing protein [Flavobacterium psychrophilum]|uniref:PspC domain-containing protein n=1 Tax=Flavobacterium psychrophilum TaxID=96345 RepID=UPI0004F8B441|nr:PspC domain-containing protein [Flavobacterium psychrophilum]AIN73913.1 phage-shock protein [Flavobacterium psychrophilum FPG3]EKT2068912.1 PspC domain-containing protein [Flavobacterium psychrophilum]EKT2071012.1 PspC domain-containing protein [Flavobacterium psychrophilum]EKT4490531.1 PspC domain-containing protein [Flavobacterium psychrophilum]MBF2044755.1 PspC domain-containing protein [Flavobacterium psychrophilum]